MYFYLASFNTESSLALSSQCGKIAAKAMAVRMRWKYLNDLNTHVWFSLTCYSKGSFCRLYEDEGWGHRSFHTNDVKKQNHSYVHTAHRKAFILCRHCGYRSVSLSIEQCAWIDLFDPFIWFVDTSSTLWTLQMTWALTWLHLYIHTVLANMDLISCISQAACL